jgi:hypothetical protein
MENKTVRPGTCILITSLSYLSRVGAAAYAAEWRVAVDMLVSSGGSPGLPGLSAPFL